jgi:hypothetical protein
MPPLTQPPKTPSTFTLTLTDWSMVKQGSHRYLCVNFNFDGLGRSGSFQKVHGLYRYDTSPRANVKIPLVSVADITPTCNSRNSEAMSW